MGRGAEGCLVEETRSEGKKRKPFFFILFFILFKNF